MVKQYIIMQQRKSREMKKIIISVILVLAFALSAVSAAADYDLSFSCVEGEELEYAVAEVGAVCTVNAKNLPDGLKAEVRTINDHIAVVIIGTPTAAGVYKAELNVADEIIVNLSIDVKPANTAEKVAGKAADDSGKTVERITLVKAPAKTTYNVGEKLDTTGLSVRAFYIDGTTAVITEGLSCDVETIDTAGKREITVTYAGQSCVFTVKAERAASELSVVDLPEKTEYIVGESLDITGLTLRYATKNGEELIVAKDCDKLSYSVDEFKADGKQAVTVTYSGEEKLTCEFDVNVKPAEKTEEPEQAPAKTEPTAPVAAAEKNQNALIIAIMAVILIAGGVSAGMILKKSKTDKTDKEDKKDKDSKADKADKKDKEPEADKKDTAEKK